MPHAPQESHTQTTGKPTAEKPLNYWLFGEMPHPPQAIPNSSAYGVMCLVEAGLEDCLWRVWRVWRSRQMDSPVRFALSPAFWYLLGQVCGKMSHPSHLS